MQESSVRFVGRDAYPIAGRRWVTDTAAPPDAPAAVQIAHGMGEHSARYARFAEALTDAGYVVYGYDHRGHGLTAQSADELGHFGADGWNAVVTDMRLVGEQIDVETGGIPRIVFAHSMGSFALQQFLLDHSHTIAGAVLSGTSAVDALAGAVPADDSPADLTAFNAPFEPARTPSDWLSRDAMEVDKYVADPLCGFGVDAQALRDMAAEAPRAADPAALALIRNDLPLLMVLKSQLLSAGDTGQTNFREKQYRYSEILK